MKRMLCIGFFMTVFVSLCQVGCNQSDAEPEPVEDPFAVEEPTTSAAVDVVDPVARARM